MQRCFIPVPGLPSRPGGPCITRRECTALDDVDVEPTIAVVIQQPDAARCRLGDLSLGRAAVFEDEPEPGGLGQVDESGHSVRPRGVGGFRPIGRVRSGIDIGIDELGERGGGRPGRGDLRPSWTGQGLRGIGIRRRVSGPERPPSLRLERSSQRIGEAGELGEVRRRDRPFEDEPVAILGCVEPRLAVAIVPCEVMPARFPGQRGESIRRRSMSPGARSRPVARGPGARPRDRRARAAIQRGGESRRSSLNRSAGEPAHGRGGARPGRRRLLAARSSRASRDSRILGTPCRRAAAVQLQVAASSIRPACCGQAGLEPARRGHRPGPISPPGQPPTQPVSIRAGRPPARQRTCAARGPDRTTCGSPPRYQAGDQFISARPSQNGSSPRVWRDLRRGRCRGCAWRPLEEHLGLVEPAQVPDQRAGAEPGRRAPPGRAEVDPFPGRHRRRDIADRVRADAQTIGDLGVLGQFDEAECSSRGSRNPGTARDEVRHTLGELLFWGGAMGWAA